MSLYTELRTKVIGAPLDPLSEDTRHNIALVAFFAWVGLGADGISSSCYGPEESFRALGEHTGLGPVPGPGDPAPPAPARPANGNLANEDLTGC
jgi:hypothetical protein